MTKQPKHIAIIMDGNGRWAEEHQLPRIEGHRRGAEVSEEIIDACIDRHISCLTLYAFSEENWNRPPDEVEALMELLGLYLTSKRQKMINEGIRFQTIGDINRLSSFVRDEVERTKEATRDGTKLTLTMALSYGSRQELCRAFQKLLGMGVKEVTPEIIDRALDTRGLPDPDLLIRTSGEYRMSNFLLWQLAYTELYFTDTLWPDFNQTELDKALAAFSKRERRFGMTREQLRELA